MRWRSARLGVVALIFMGLPARGENKLKSGNWLCRSHIGVDISDQDKIEKNVGTTPVFVARIQGGEGNLKLKADMGKRTHESRFSVTQETGILFVMRDHDGGAEYFSTIFLNNDGTYVQHYPGYGATMLRGSCDPLE